MFKKGNKIILNKGFSLKLFPSSMTRMSNLKASYQLILGELRKIPENENLYFKPIKQKLSDLEVISLIIVAEFKSIDSEHQLLEISNVFEIEHKIERSVYNRIKRKLFPFIEEIRRRMVEKLFSSNLMSILWAI